MDDMIHHDMQLLTTHPSGAEEWFCPTCGRRFLMHWPPSYRKIVLEPGDEGATHRGGHGAPLAAGSQPAAPAAEEPAEGPPDFSEPDRDDGLGPWRRFFERLDS